MCKTNKNISDKTISGIIYYVEILNNININFFKLISLDCIDNMNILKNIYLDICSQTNMIIQTQIDYSITDISDINRLKLCTKNQGINKYKTDFNYLEKDINSIFSKNQSVLYNMKRIRNKIEHDLDTISLNELHSGSGICGVKFTLNNQDISINSNDIQKIVTDLNSLFYKMIKDIDDFISKNDSDNYYHPFYKNLRRYRFDRYNKIIKSSILYDVSVFINNMN